MKVICQLITLLDSNGVYLGYFCEFFISKVKWILISCQDNFYFNQTAIIESDELVNG